MTQTPEASVADEAAKRPPRLSPQPPGQPQGGAAPRGRDPHLDNAKFLAILFVAGGHGIAALKDQAFAAGLYNFFYMFHMPVFVLVSGYLSKRFTLTDDKVVRLVGSTLVPYLIFQAAYSLFAWQAGGREFKFSLLTPYYLTWFLLALFVWRLLTPVWRRLRYPVATAMLVSLLVYMTELGSIMDLYRMLGLLPFYVLGLTLRPEMLEIVRRPAMRVIGAVILVGGLVFAYLTYDRMNVRWVRWSHSNSDMGVDELTGTLMRLVLLLIGFVLLTAFLAVTPSRRTWYTDLGTTTLYGYLLHGFFTRLFQFTDWHKHEWFDTVPGILATLVFCFVLVTVLSSAPVRRVTRWAVEPNIGAMFTRK